MSLSFNNEYQNIWDPETDPLEIKEEITIKDEKIDDIKEEIYIKDEKIDYIKEELCDIVSDFEIDNSINSHAGIQKERNIISNSVSLSNQLNKHHVTGASNVLKNKPTQLTALNSSNCKSIKIVQLKNNSINSVIDKTKKNDTCKCMTSIEYYCIKCNKAFFYSKDKNACSDCNTLLKLKCKICHKRYKILNTVNQVSQSNKEVPVSNSTNQNVISPSKKMKTLFCSKCIFNTKFENVLKKHMDYIHNEDADKYIELCCPNCFRTCKELSYGLKQTCEVCAEKMSYRCIFCKKIYKVLKNMRHHVTSVCWHYINSDKLSCSQCTFKADSQSTLVFHEKAHHKLMICANCNKVFVGTIELQEHILQACDISATLNIDSSTRVSQDLNEAMSDEDTNLLDRLKVNKIVKKSVPSRETKIMPKSAQSCNKKKFSSSQKIVESSRFATTSKSKTIPSIFSNKQKRLIPAAGFDRDTNLSDKSKLPESITFLNDEDYFKIVENNPDTMINEITGKPIKDLTCWRALIDYYCLQCDDEAKKKFSRFRPRCPNCKVKYDYRCINCEKLYGGYVSIYRHVKYECLSKQTLDCPLCDFSSVRKHHLIIHIKTKHSVYECLQCNCRYTGHISFKNHQRFECKIGNLRNISDIKQLMTLYCEKCFKRFKVSEEEEQLICKRCKNSMRYQCLKCYRKFDDKDITSKHIEQGCEPILVCKMCSYKAYTQRDYDIHLKYMHTDKRCPYCGVQFKDTQIFHLHLLEEERRKKKRESKLKYPTFNQPLIVAKKRVDNDKDCTLSIKGKKLKSD